MVIARASRLDFDDLHHGARGQGLRWRINRTTRHEKSNADHEHYQASDDAQHAAPQSPAIISLMWCGAWGCVAGVTDLAGTSNVVKALFLKIKAPARWKERTGAACPRHMAPGCECGE